MARIAGIDLPKAKNVDIALTYIYGIGRSSARSICGQARVNLFTKVKDLAEDEIGRLRSIIEKNYKVEGERKSSVSQDIKRLIDIGSYRGSRHKSGLPVRGQRTRCNARTRKGPRKTVAGKKKAADKT
ncbi:MAG: 30S ribosomal protein S13 [Candidatus Lindowbacteria bacterium RIFCSPLOWO2_12_FULL_62_27]|nr:MAG: 30S ribosomal protein S13 [Candidatus Lindowbacteria bacterium RIFCSPLOWO2_12_FULL_62_27]OGH63581.1 MAG: 30S ribosomal protein S13 [Candidatus Lindowbacteria bacterium RIFCSPLOWO2_02_FULL_62_12]